MLTVSTSVGTMVDSVNYNCCGDGLPRTCAPLMPFNPSPNVAAAANAWRTFRIASAAVFRARAAVPDTAPGTGNTNAVEAG